MALTVQQIVNQVKLIKGRFTTKDRYMSEVKAVREGRWDEVFPGMLPADFPRPFVSNMIDIAARDTSEVIAPLPTFSCGGGTQVSDAARARADKRTRIVNYYVDCSNLQTQMFSGADRLLTYGFLPMLVQPDFDKQMPRILLENPYRSYYLNSPYGDVTHYYFKVFRRYIDDLMAEFPEAAERLRRLKPYSSEQRQVDVVRWWDSDQLTLIVPEGAILLVSTPNPISRCPVRVIELAKLGDCVRGQYDDAVGVQGARTLAQTYALQAMEEVVNAPWALPHDVQEVPIGPQAVLHTDNPEKAKRIDLQIPPGVFAEAQALTAETRLATRYPEGRSGSIDASIITGQGVEALLGTFSTQTKTAQLLLAAALRDVMALAFEMDQALWPNVQKSADYRINGQTRKVTYAPKKDIAGDYSCDVTYGLTAGLDPNRATVFVLQNLTAGLISKRTAMEQLPVDIDIEQEKQLMDIEMLRDASAQAMAGLAQAIPMMASQGMDPVQIATQIAEVVRLRERGTPIEEAVARVFTPPPPPESPEGQPPGAEQAGQPQVFDQETGLPPGIAQGQAQYGPGGAQDLLMSLAGTTASGNPNLSLMTSRRIPVG